MPYVGRQNITGEFIKLDAITTSATNTFNLFRNGAAFSPATAEQCIVSVNGVTQAPQDAFNISGSQIVFTSTLSANDVIDYILVMGNALSAGVPSDGSVSTAKLANNSVDLTSKVTGILPTTNGGVGFTSTTRPFFHAEAFTTSGITSQTGVLDFNSVVTNQGSHWNSTNDRFEVPVNGIYQFNFNGFGSRITNGGVMHTNDNQVILQKSTDSGSNYTTASAGGYGFFNSGNGYINLSFSISLSLNSGDYIRFNAIKAYVFIGTKADNYVASVSGHLVG